MTATAEDPTALGIAGLAAGMAEGRLDPVAVTEAFLARIDAEDAALRSFITVAAASAHTDAAASRRRHVEGRALGPLDGVPIAVKDNIDVAGLPCTAGTRAFRTRIPEHDAAVVARLRGQGAVVLGKAAMHEAALGAATDNPAHGCCMTPPRPGHTPGGPGGGAATALAAHLCAGALGTDTMGSVRIPAACCGVLGFKPGNGAVPAEGVAPLSFTLDCVGPLARSAGDLALLAEAMLDLPPRGMGQAGPPSVLRALRIGVPAQLASVELAPDVAAAFAAALAALRAAGAAVGGVDLPAWSPGAARRAGLLVAETEAALWYAAQLGPGLPGLSEPLRAMLDHPARAGLRRVAAAYRTVEAVRLACARAFVEVDLLALPSAPRTSFSHGAAPPANQADCAALANFGRAPALALPLSTAAGLPAGLQLIAAPGTDRALLALAPAAERALAARAGG